MDFNAQNWAVNLRLKMSNEGEFRLPPVGVTKTRYQLGGKTYVKHSVRCGVEGCWFMGGSFGTSQEADQYLADHQQGGKNFTEPCPAPPRRESLPSGLSYVEKLWRELDDVVDHLASAELPADGYRGMNRMQLAGFGQGLAFSIVMLEPVHFKSIKEVAAHARDRRKMRLGDIPWSPTPTGHKHNATTVEVKGLHPEPTAPVAEPSEDVKKAIRGALASGMFQPAELAEVYKLPASYIETLRG